LRAVCLQRSLRVENVGVLECGIHCSGSAGAKSVDGRIIKREEVAIGDERIDQYRGTANQRSIRANSIGSVVNSDVIEVQLKRGVTAWLYFDRPGIGIGAIAMIGEIAALEPHVSLRCTGIVWIELNHRPSRR